MQANPMRNDCKDMGFFLMVQRMMRCNAVPFLQTTTTTGRRRMLCDKYGMSAHRRLPAIIFWLHRSKPLVDEP